MAPPAFSVPKSKNPTSSIVSPNDLTSTRASVRQRARKDSLACDHSFLPFGADLSNLEHDFDSPQEVDRKPTFTRHSTLMTKSTNPNLGRSSTKASEGIEGIAVEDRTVRKKKMGQCFVSENQMKELPFDGKRVKRAGRCCPQSSYNAVWNSVNAFQTDVVDKFFGCYAGEDTYEPGVSETHATNSNRAPYRSQTSRLNALDDIAVDLPFASLKKVGSVVAELHVNADVLLGDADEGAGADFTDFAHGVHHTAGDGLALLGTDNFTKVKGRPETRRGVTGVLDEQQKLKRGTIVAPQLVN
jgi:hypothetical protein